jgi:hypothetical protein
MNTKAAGFPPLSRPSPATSLLPPSRSPTRSTHLGWGTRHTHSSAQGPPGLETPTDTTACPTFYWVHKVLEDMHIDMTQVGMGVEMSM